MFGNGVSIWLYHFEDLINVNKVRCGLLERLYKLYFGDLIDIVYSL